MNEIRFIDLFSGIGGFRLGLERANRGVQGNGEHDSGHKRGWKWGTGTLFQQTEWKISDDRSGTYPKSHFRCVWSCDNDKYANQIYTKQFGEENHHTANIRGVNPEEIPDFDLLCAGFPCQTFSVAGKRKGFEDTRGTLFFEICRIAEAKRPSLLLLENVKGLLNHDGGRTFTIILQSLDELGYSFIEWQCLNSKYFGVPQNRKRVFIIGYLRGKSRREIFPITTDNEETSKKLRRIGNITETRHDSLSGRVFNPDGLAMNVNAEGGGRGAKTGLYAIPVLAPDRLVKQQHGRRFKEDGEPSFTLTGQDKHGIMIDSHKIRRLTPIECERLQGFPDRWTEIALAETQRKADGKNKMFIRFWLKQMFPKGGFHVRQLESYWLESVSKLEKLEYYPVDGVRYRCLGNAVTVNVIEFLGELIAYSRLKENKKE